MAEDTDQRLSHIEQNLAGMGEQLVSFARIAEKLSGLIERIVRVEERDSYQEDRTGKIELSIEKIYNKMDEKFEKVDKKIDDKFEAHTTRVEGNFKLVNDSFVEVNKKITGLVIKVAVIAAGLGAAGAVAMVFLPRFAQKLIQ